MCVSWVVKNLHLKQDSPKYTVTKKIKEYIENSNLGKIRYVNGEY